MDAVTWIIDYIYGWEKYNYYLSTIFTKYVSYKLLTGIWWNHIDDNIILGGIPLHNSAHLEALKNEGVKAVLSLVEDFEMKPSIYFHPVTKDDWEKNGVKFLQIQVADRCGVQLDDIDKCMEYIIDNLKNHRKIYVHCKAGKGRSASIVMCYLLWNICEEKGFINEEDVINSYKVLKSLRGEIYINDIQFDPIREYAEILRNKGRSKSV